MGGGVGAGGGVAPHSQRAGAGVIHRPPSQPYSASPLPHYFKRSAVNVSTTLIHYSSIAFYKLICYDKTRDYITRMLNPINDLIYGYKPI